MRTKVGEKFINLAMKMADASGEVIRHFYRRPIAIDMKEDESPVTLADRKAEAVIRNIIEKKLPGHGFIGEELGSFDTDSKYVWVVDPIDGTKSFISGLPTFGTLISLVREGEPVIGIIDQPILGERWIGVQSQPTRFNGKIVKTRKCEEITNASLYASGPDMFVGGNARLFDNLSRVVRQTRYGYDCYAYAMLASGFVDVVCEADMKFYDYAALIPIIEGAGGVMSDWDGNTLTAESDGRILAVGDERLKDIALSRLASGHSETHASMFAGYPNMWNELSYWEDAWKIFTPPFGK
ncbi:MAG: histidinol-phosphatase [Alphaproteobacteria bacterium]|nr:histidinol-phosphatase [Alphaproteobacteria bacterium]